MGELLEVAKALVSPTEKLIASVQGAIGKIYEPRYVKKMADAKAHEILVLGEAMRNMCDIPIAYNKDCLELNTKDTDEFIKRTQSRMAYQELVKQQNIESVVSQSYDLLNGGPDITSEPVDNDWLLRFFNSVQNVSNDEMQKIWAKILAGEIQSPGSFSLRTLECLRNLSQREALSFQKILSFATNANDNSIVIPYYFDILKNYGIKFKDLLMLDEAGLLQLKEGSSIQNEAGKGETIIMEGGNNYEVTISSRDGKKHEFVMPIIVFTSAGCELSTFLDEEFNMDYLIDFFNKHQRGYKYKEIKIRLKQFIADSSGKLRCIDLLEEI